VAGTQIAIAQQKHLPLGIQTSTKFMRRGTSPNSRTSEWRPCSV